MKRRQGRPSRGAAAIAILCIIALALWQWQALARFAIVAAADSIMHVHLSFGRMMLASDRAVFDDVRVTSLRNEPIAQIARLSIAYDSRDWLPIGKRLFGLKVVDADSPHLTIIRRPDGTYNVPFPHLQPNQPVRQRPLIVAARIRNGSVEVVDQRPQAVAGERRFYIENLGGDAEISSVARSRYAITLQYGERRDRLYPIRGRGDIDPQDGYVNQRWTATELPIAAAVNFVADSASLRFLGGMLRDVDARYVGLADAGGTLHTHIAASAVLYGGRISIAGLSRPIENIRGPLDVYDDGLLTPRFYASLAGVPVQISGGIYGLQSPRLRMVVRGAGESEQLRSAFAQAKRLPIRGPLLFGLLVEGTTAKPVTWIDLHSPHLVYASTSLERLTGLVAFDGREADVIGLHGAYGQVNLTAGGRAAFVRQPGAIDMLVGVQTPSDGVPYVGTLLPHLSLRGIALATADDPKAIALHGTIWGASATQRLDAVFNVDSRGAGSVGPLHVSDGRGSLYARVALDRPQSLSVGVIEARDFPIAPLRARLNGTIFGGQAKAGVGVGVDGRLTGSWGEANARGNLALTNGALRGSLFGDVAGEASFGATVAGTPQSPRIAGTVVVAGGRYRDFEVNGNAGLAYADGALELHDTTVAVGPLFVGVAGTIEGLSPQGAFAPRYDLNAQLHSSDVSTLLATVQPKTAALVQGSLDADVHVRGTGLSPAFAGTVSAPEGSVNGLAFRDLRGAVSGDSGALSLTGGRVLIGSTALGLHGDTIRGSTRVAVAAPNTDLADFNDFFDAGDTFAGTGRLALQATLDGTHVVATSGAAQFSNTRVRRLQLGNVAAHWETTEGTVVSALSFGGPTGEVHVAGSVTPAVMAVNLQATARAVDLGTWLPMLGFNAPITGRLDAQTAFSGRYPDIAMRLHAAVFGGTAGRLTISHFEVTASALHGRGTIQSAILEVPSLTTVASGTFGLRHNDAIALVAHSTSADVGAFLLHATGKNLHVSATLDSTLHVDGTRDTPRLRDTITLESLRYGNLTIPRVAGEIGVDRHAVRVQSGEVDLVRGKALLTAMVPIAFSSSRVTPGNGPISASLRADDVELSNFSGLLPKGTQTSGRIDGQVAAQGTVAAPELGGSLALRDGRFSGPMERSPIAGINADLSFAGTRAQLQSHAVVGGGTVTARAAASLTSLRRPADSTMNFTASAQNARLDLPGYFQGVLTGDVALGRAPSAAPKVSGNVSVSNARIPLNAFLNQQGGGAPHPRLPNVVFDSLHVAAGANVRVQSANVDIGTAGVVALGGTLNAPTLAGSFRSTGGSLSFYRNFNLERGEVQFDPSSGVIPDVNAVATTFVSDPATAIRLHVTGPATNMNLALASDPAYSREQILGLLVGAQQFGAVRGVRTNGSQSFSAGSAAANVALGQLNTVFTRNLLEPLSSSVAGTLGFTEVQITTDIQTGLGVSAVKAFGKNVNAIFSQSFGYPKTQSITLEARPSVGTGLRLTAYSSQGPTVLALQQTQPIGMDVMNLNPQTAFTPAGGTNGITFSFQRKFP